MKPKAMITFLYRTTTLKSGYCRHSERSMPKEKKQSDSHHVPFETNEHQAVQSVLAATPVC